MSLNCLICQCPLEAGEPQAECPGCQARYHQDCWEENRGCAVYGCEHVPATDKHDSVEVPTGYWGQEYKPCPACGKEIMAVAKRCRHCGTTFETARPQDKAEFRKRAGLKRERGSAQNTVGLIFALCVLPCSAPVGFLMALVWTLTAKEQVKDLPPLYSGLLKLGIGLALVESVFSAVILAMFGARH